MTIHILKLCVGADSVEDLAEWQIGQIKRAKKDKRPHIAPVCGTRMWPKRVEDVLAGGSLYWVIKGNVQCRQRLLEIRPFTDGEGIGRCHLMLDPAVVATQWQPRRAFQGWRYLKPEDAPRDLGADRSALRDLPAQLRRELADLGLL